MSDQPKLLNCPFCGAKARHESCRIAHWIACEDSCPEFMGHTYKSAQEAAASWNARAPVRVKLPQQYVEESCDGYDAYMTEVKANGEWVKVDEMIAAIKAAGGEVVQ